MTRRSALWIGAAVTALLSGGFYVFLRSWTARAEIGPPRMEAASWLILCSAAVAIVGSFWLTRHIIRWLAASSPAGARGSVTALVSAYIFGGVSFPFALFLGVTIGASVGGGWGDQLIGSSGVVVGVGLGLFIMTVVVVAPAAVAGFLLGRLITRFLLSHKP